MKITLDVPDTTVCAYFCYVKRTDECMEMNCTILDSDDLKDGNEINIPKEKKHEVHD